MLDPTFSIIVAFQIDLLSYNSVHSELDPENEKLFNGLLPPQEVWSNMDASLAAPSKTDLRIQFSQSSMRRNYSDALKMFAGLVGGSFLHSFSPSRPIFTGNDSNYHFFLPRETLSAEALHKWMLAIPFTQEKVCRKRKLPIDPMLMHQCSHIRK